MTTTTNILEREQIKQLADQYRNQGYDVIFKPGPDFLPEFIQNYRPDLLLRRNDESVIVEVKSHSDLDTATGQFLRGVAEKVNQQPGWRFELIMTNSNQKFSTLKIEQSLQEDDIRSRLTTARELSQYSLEAAFLYAWSLVEATLRLITQKEKLQVEILNSLTLIKKLTSEGLLDRAQYHLLMHSQSLRNIVVHGFKPAQLIANDVIDLINLIEELLVDLENDLT